MLWRTTLVLIAFSLACSDSDPDPAGNADAAVAPPDAGVDVQACREDQAAHWEYALPAQCEGRRTCVDDRMRFWVHGEPFIPRGVYNGGYEYERVLGNCPEGAACEATQPADVVEYVGAMTDAGFNLIMERSRFVRQELLDAIHDDPKMRIAHLLWADPFTLKGHDSMVGEIEDAVADEDVVMWFGPDEVDLNNNWAMAAGIKRLLHGSNAEIDEVLAMALPAEGDPYVPVTEPAHDLEGLPLGAALAWDWGLDRGPSVYDILFPITYPFTQTTSAANFGRWGTWRVSSFGDRGRPVLPVLQMIGIPSMGLSHPTPQQTEVLIASAIAHGARGAFYYNYTGDQPVFLGRQGWYAPDDTENWAAFAAMHAVQDALIPVMFGEASDELGSFGPLEWRQWELGDRRVVLIVNPTSQSVPFVDLDELIGPQPEQRVREYASCAPFTPGTLEVPGYAWYLLEVY